VVYLLRKLIWAVPGYSVDRHRDRLRDLHDQIERDGVFRSTTSRTLIEARKPREVLAQREGGDARCRRLPV
jgi:hypothetical protein